MHTMHYFREYNWLRGGAS